MLCPSPNRLASAGSDEVEMEGQIQHTYIAEGDVTVGEDEALIRRLATQCVLARS